MAFIGHRPHESRLHSTQGYVCHAKIRSIGTELYVLYNVRYSSVLIFHFIVRYLSFLGKVLVNCLMGMSRSSTCVLAYLMLRQNMTAVEALTEVRRHREVRPNDGFLRQLADLDNKLRRDRGQLKTKS